MQAALGFTQKICWSKFFEYHDPISLPPYRRENKFRNSPFLSISRQQTVSRKSTCLLLSLIPQTPPSHFDVQITRETIPPSGGCDCCCLVPPRDYELCATAGCYSTNNSHNQSSQNSEKSLTMCVVWVSMGRWVGGSVSSPITQRICKAKHLLHLAAKLSGGGVGVAVIM